jgi:hypothetical protein
VRYKRGEVAGYNGKGRDEVRERSGRVCGIVPAIKEIHARRSLRGHIENVHRRLLEHVDMSRQSNAGHQESDDRVWKDGGRFKT